MSTLKAKKFRNGYKLYCEHTGEYYGPHFKNADSIMEFINWYCGDPRYIGTWINMRTWEEILKSHNPDLP